MKFKLTLHKEFEIDTDTHWDKDLTGLYEKLRENFDEGEAVEAIDIQVAIEAMLADDIETVVDLDLDETDFKVVVEFGTSLTIPVEPEDC